MSAILKQLDLFAGIGAFSLAARNLEGIETTQFVEIEPFCQKVLEKNFQGVPIHDDVSTFTATRGQFDLVTAGFPCQDLSAANHNGRGLEGERSGLFFEIIRLLRAIQPRFLLLENVPNLFNRGFDRVLREISESGYDAEWQVISAASVGAPHLRERLFIIAYPRRQSSWMEKQKANGQTWKSTDSLESAVVRPGDGATYAEGTGAGNQPTSDSQSNGQRSRLSGDNHPLQQPDGAQLSQVSDRKSSARCGEHQGAVIARIRRVDDGLSPWLDRPYPDPLSIGSRDRAARLKALGNSIVPQCAEIPLKRILELANVEQHF